MIVLNPAKRRVAYENQSNSSENLLCASCLGALLLLSLRLSSHLGFCLGFRQKIFSFDFLMVEL